MRLLISKGDATHAIANAQHVHVHAIGASDATGATGGRCELETRRIDARKVQGARHLSLVQCERERPRVQRKRVQDVIRERRRVHLGNDGVWYSADVPSNSGVPLMYNVLSANVYLDAQLL